MADEKFKLPWSSYEELVKIVKAYGSVDEAVGLSEVKKLSGLNPSTISSNNGFLTAVGVLESGAKKVPTELGKKLALALEHDVREDIVASWREAVCGNEFFTKLLTAIRIRDGMDEQTLESHIAYSAGQPKKKPVMTGARTVVDILRVANLITESDGKISAMAVMPETLGTEVRPAEKVSKPGPLTVRTPGQAEPDESKVPISIRININCTPSELEGLAEKVRTLQKDIAKRDSTDDEAA